MKLRFALPLAAFLAIPPLVAQPASAPAAYSAEQAKAILDKTQEITLAPDLSRLGAQERQAVAKLLEAGAIFQRLYEEQRYAGMPRVRRLLAQAPAALRPAYLTLYRLFQGPIATNLENRREPFLAVPDAPPGKNVYPADLTKAEMDAFLAAHPDARAGLMNPLSVVRRADAASLSADLATLRANPVLDILHPGLRANLEQRARRPDRRQLYAVPYSVAYAREMLVAHGLLNEAAALLEPSDAELAGYLRNRARDLLSDDYESGDAAWVTARFRRLNVQVGAYETYDDELYGTRAFYSLSLLLVRAEETAAIRRGMQGLQAVEDALPYDRHKKVREDIPVGAYDVIADFGQSRGGNTASILPNDALHARRYGRTILLRANIMRSPEIFSAGNAAWRAAVAPGHAADLTADSTFHRTLWHEVGHYLGVDRTADGRDLDAALGANGNLLEEMKADLVSLFAGEELRRRGYFTEAGLRSHYASGIFRTLQNVRPRREQPYQTMQLMQMNWFLENGVLRFDPASQRLSIDYGRYREAVTGLLREVLALQDRGDSAAADAFIARWSRWDDNLHGRIAANMRSQQRYRYRLFLYQALDGAGARG
ncbi:MAG TPA: hypothetical protein VEC11_17865 [Allosphingosinicella sp.]|nr:hypothetical protein [Allosphingosinicella sp.]